MEYYGFALVQEISLICDLQEPTRKGLRPYSQWLNLDHRDFHVFIEDLDTATVVYREGSG